MIYFDNSATTIQKPPAVSQAVAHAINNFGNAGRSFYDFARLASREIFQTRMEIANLIGLDEPLNVAFTSSATESLNLVIGGLVEKNDHVITTVAEHNSVLRPLYLSGCALDFIDCDDSGILQIDSFESLLKPTTKFLVCTHGSNVTGNITDVKKLYSLCKSHEITMISDISQTFGTVSVETDMADIFCFTGHKGLFGPQGTGGVIINGKHNFNIKKTGGAGVNSFDALQSSDMPDIFEVGTLNSHSIYGLQKGVRFIIETGINTINKKEMHLLKLFYNGIKHCENITIYGDFSSFSRLPIISLNIDGQPSSELAEQLWEKYNIATRAGSHCAPLLHKHFGTTDTGIVRFSFSYFNTEEEVQKGIDAIKEIAKNKP
ncbi:MAG: aminotransferase class V-fold PLP-dependent enzyme [Oscillospiraceae bacterium]|jgi:cysteine desulfurase family protein|nr:aminotransferase class V-fold PLP-dependent enzyme [Oscillospiraceae bacterium]